MTTTEKTRIYNVTTDIMGRKGFAVVDGQEVKVRHTWAIDAERGGSWHIDGENGFGPYLFNVIVETPKAGKLDFGVIEANRSARTAA